jgi:hypothetical protein
MLVIFFMTRVSTRTASPNKLLSVRFNHGGVDAHSAPLRYTLFLRYYHNSLVDLFDDVRPQSHAPATHSFGVGHFGKADMGEVAINEVGAHFPFQHHVAPVGHVHEDEQAQHHFGRIAPPTTCAAQVTAGGQSVIDCCQDLLIRQHLVGMDHPVLVETFDFLGDQSVPRSRVVRVADQSRAFLPRCDE